MHTTTRCLTALLLALGVTQAARADDDPLTVVTTLPYLKDVAEAIGGKHVKVEALAPPGFDPHFIQPTPARSLTLSKADVLIENGIQLELWSERVIDGARNRKIRPSFPGHVYAALGIRPLQVPKQQSRAGGDVHVGGNPHVWLDPMNLKRIAKNIESTFSAVLPKATADFKANREAFEKQIDERFYGKRLIKLLGRGRLNLLHKRGRLIKFLNKVKFHEKPLAAQAGGWLKRAMALKGLKVISYHLIWIYFESSFGIKVTGTVEEKPGIPPSPTHLTQLEETARATGTKVVIAAPFYPFSRAQGVAEQIGGVAVPVPTQPGEVGTKDIWGMYDKIFDQLEAAVKKASKS